MRNSQNGGKILNCTHNTIIDFYFFETFGTFFLITVAFPDFTSSSTTSLLNSGLTSFSDMLSGLLAAFLVFLL